MTDLEQIRQWAERWPDANWAIATGGKLVVIDIDPRNGGNETLAKLEAESGPQHCRHIVRTGGDGLHWYLSTPVPIRCGKLGPGVDVKGEGGYVIAPGSNHISGDSYKFVGGLSLAPMATVQAAWLRLLTAKAEEGILSAARPVLTGEEYRGVLSVARAVDPADGLRSYPPESGLLCPLTGTGKRIWAAARRCIVTDHGQTNDRFPELATSLKNIPELRDVRAVDLLPVVHWWYQQSVKNMTDKEWESVKKRWLYLWNEWSKPEVGPAWIVAAVLVESGGIQGETGQPVLRALCEEMQQQAGNGIWYLSCRTAADVLTSLGFVVDYTTASRWLKQLVADGFLVKPWDHERGSLRAQRYQTAAAAARCEQHDRQREQQQAPALVFAPINSLAAFKLPQVQPARTLADVFATAGRDEPVSTPSLMFNWRPAPVESAR